MRRCGAAVFAAVALVAVSALPASAQSMGDVDVLDLPQMGFALAQGEGYPGDLVMGQVDVDDVAEYCLSVDELVGNVVNEVDASLEDWAESPPADGLTEEEVEIFADTVETLRIGVQVFPETAEQLWVETFVFTFADATTQELLGDTGNFDPLTGEGSIVVPQLEPNVYGLAAACVQLTDADSLLNGGYDTAALVFWDWIETDDIDVPENRDPIDEDWQEFVEASALVWVPELVVPRAVGIDVFCILTPDGACGDPAVEELEEPGAPGDPDPDPAPAVEARPAFTG